MLIFKLLILKILVLKLFVPRIYAFFILEIFELEMFISIELVSRFLEFGLFYSKIFIKLELDLYMPKILIILI